MIAVIADDFTGAAEIGGIGLSCGLKVEIDTRINPRTTAELLIIAADTRSASVKDAIDNTRAVVLALRPLNPELVYKKVDSVLRGHILEELATHMQVAGRDKALVVPANPSLGRIIKDGVYYLDAALLHETSFGSDPGFRITSSRVADIVNRAGYPEVTVAKPHDRLPGTGVIIGEAADTGDLRYWLSQADGCLLAGAAGFFQEVLTDRGLVVRAPQEENFSPIMGKKMLLACGSAFSASKNAVEKAAALGAPVCRMPGELVTAAGEAVDRFHRLWSEEAIRLFGDHNRVVLSFGDVDAGDDQSFGALLCHHMAAAIGKITAAVPVEELLLEGGATASSALNELGIERCYPTEELAYGVIRMAVPGNDVLHVTLKPGSYPWPPFIWDFGK